MDMSSEKSQRRWLVLLTVIAVYICFLDRIAISVAIIPMSADNDWSPATQGTVMSSFFIGYLLLQVPAGFLADRFGGKWVLGIGVLLWSVFTLLTPSAAALGLTALLVCRVLMGMSEAVTWPSIYSTYAVWVPIEERGSAVGWMNSGIAGGSVIALLLTPFIVEYFDWQTAFYIYGCLGLLWFLVWAPTVPAAPAVPLVAQTHTADDFAVGRRQPLSAAALLRSKGVWAIAVSHICANWVIFLGLSWLPTYFSTGLGVDFKSVGLMAVVPAVASMLATPVAGRWCDTLIGRGASRIKVRKAMQATAFGTMALCLAVVGYTQQPILALALFTLGNMMMALCIGGFGTNHMDIAPEDSGTLMGITNTLGSLSSALAVFVSGMVLEWTGSWLLVFQLAAGVALFGMVFYLRYASVEREF